MISNLIARASFQTTIYDREGGPVPGRFSFGLHCVMWTQAK